MIGKTNSMFALAQLVIILAGFLFLISTVFFVMERNFAFQGVEEMRRNLIAEERNESTLDVKWFSCFSGVCEPLGNFFEQSYRYNRLKYHTFITAVLLTILAFMIWYLGYKQEKA